MAGVVCDPPYLAEACLDAASSYTSAGWGPWGWAGWDWAPWFDAYTFIPGDGIWYSPFGWGFYSPWWVFDAPFFGYGLGCMVTAMAVGVTSITSVITVIGNPILPTWQATALPMASTAVRSRWALVFTWGLEWLELEASVDLDAADSMAVEVGATAEAVNVKRP